MAKALEGAHAKHAGCLASTDEGFEDAAASVPKARLL
jgi:hypothetical protein